MAHETDSDFELEEYLPYQIHRLSNLIHQVSGLVTVRHLKAAKTLTNREYRVIFIIGSLGPHSPVQVARLSGIDNATVTRAVRSLRSRGLVTTRDNPEDRRAKDIVFTAAGRALWRKLFPIMYERGAALDEAFSERERKTFNRLLAKLNARCEELIE